MAYVTSASYGGRYLKLECWENATDVVQNYSQVGATLSSIGGSVAYYSIYNWGGDVNGNRLWGISTTYWNSYAFPAATGSDTKYINVYHNADGSVGNVGFTLYGKVYYGGTASFDGALGLSQFNRGTTVYQSLNSKTPTSITMNWSTTNTADYVWYSTNNGSSWTGIWSGSASSGTYTISGLSPNTSYNIKTRARRQDTQRDGNYSGTTAISTYQSYSTVTSVTTGNLMPFTMTAYCTSSNAGNTDSYEYSLCDSNLSVLQTYTTNLTYYNFTGLNEETTYYIRCRVKSTDSQVWSGYSYSSAFTTPADQSKGYIKINGTWTLGKVYHKENGSWVKVKKTYLKYGDSWHISKNP